MSKQHLFDDITSYIGREYNVEDFNCKCRGWRRGKEQCLLVCGSLSLGYWVAR